MRVILGLLVALILLGSIPLFITDGGARADSSYTPTRGNTIIVDINGTGDFGSIHEALDGTEDHDTILVKKGTYYENIQINHSVTLRGYDPDDRPILIGNQDSVILSRALECLIQRMIITSTVQSRLVYVSRYCDSMDLSECAFFGKVAGSTGIESEAPYITCQRSEFKDLFHGIKAQRNSIVKDCKFDNITGKCISNDLDVQSDLIEIENNTMIRVFNGIAIISALNTTISGNEIFGVSDYYNFGISIGGLTTFPLVRIANNTISGFTNGIELVTDAIVHITGNHLSNNSFGLRSGGMKTNIFRNQIENNNIGIDTGMDASNIGRNVIQRNNLGVIFNGNNHVFYGNFMIDNKKQFRNFGSYSKICQEYGKGGGNYWSEYEGRDIKKGPGQDMKGSDGFGDDPFMIENWTDEYPIYIDTVDPKADAGEDFSIDEGISHLFSTEQCSDDNMVTDAWWNCTYNGVPLSYHGLTLNVGFDRPGSFDITLTVYDFYGNTDSDVASVTIIDIFDPVAISGGDRSCYEGSTLWFNGNGSSDTGPIEDYEWSFLYDGEEVVLNGINVSYLFDRPGSVPVSLKVTDTAGHFDLDNFTVTIIDTTLPVADAGFDIVALNGAIVVFNGSLSTDNGELAHFTWTFEYMGKSILLQGVRPSFLFEKPGYYTISLEVSDICDNRDNDSMNLTIVDTLDPRPRITGSTRINGEEKLILSGETSTDNGEISEYVWTFDDDGSVEIKGPTIEYSFKVRGYHTIVLTVIDGWGNDASASTSVNAVDRNKPVAIAGPDQTCATGSEVVLNGSGSYDDGRILVHVWTFDHDDELILLGEKATFKFEQPGNYVVTLEVSDDNNNVGTDSLVVTVKDTGEVKGTVLDAEGDPIEGALVEIVASDGKMYTFTTAPDGSFSLSIPPGSFTWKISKDGYGTITGSSSVNILGEITLDLASTPMKKTTSTGISPILFIVPAVIVILLIVGSFIFLLMRKKVSAPETLEAQSEGEAIPPEPAEGGAPAETSLPPESSEFVQAPTVMEEDVPIEKLEDNTTVDDLLLDGGPSER